MIIPQKSKKKEKVAQKNPKKSSDAIKKIATIDMGSRSLKLSQSLRDDFNSIRYFGNFEKWFFHKFYHAFYSLAVAYSAKEIYSDTNFDLNLVNYEKTDLIGSEEEKNAINSEQLANHDNFFKAIAYWYFLRRKDPEPFKVLNQPNLARHICEGFFKEKWLKFRKMIGNYISDVPNVEICDLI